jgi:hypothetical protein
MTVNNSSPMNYKLILAILALGVLALNCNAPKEVPTPKLRTLSPAEVTSYHMPVNMQVAWVPYENLEVKMDKNNNWVIVESKDPKKSVIPVMLITYPATGDSVWVQMDTRSDLLGQLIKHTLMTQKPITEPFDAYLADAACSSCHPADVKVNFEK